MSLHLVKQKILSTQVLSGFTEIEALVNRTEERDDAPWNYCFHACHAVGGTSSKAIAAAGASLCMLLGIHLVDDLLDNDPNGIYHEIGAGTAANAALIMQSIALQLIQQSENPDEIKSAAMKSIIDMSIATSLGQNKDVSRMIITESDYWEIIREKTPPLFNSALFTGALAGGADIDTAEEISKLGLVYGQMVQISDDISDVFKDNVTADWRSGNKNNLPLLYCFEADYPEKKEFIFLAEHIDMPGSLEKAQSIVIQSGALSYCLYHLLALHEKATQQISLMNIFNKNELTKIATMLIDPALSLMKSAGGNARQIFESRYETFGD